MDLKGHYGRKISNVILLFDYLTLACLRVMFVFWLTYFFAKLGYEENSIILSLSVPVGIVISAVLFVPMVDHCKNHIPSISVMLLVLNLMVVVSTLFTGKGESSPVIYFFQLLFISILSNVPFTLSASSEILQKVESAH